MWFRAHASRSHQTAMGEIRANAEVSDVDDPQRSRFIDQILARIELRKALLQSANAEKELIMMEPSEERETKKQIPEAA